MCYSIYLLHLPLFNILERYSPVPLIPHFASIGLNSMIYTAVWGFPLATVSILFFLLVEKPCMRKDWPQRLIARLRGDKLAVPAAVPGISVAESILDVEQGETTPLSQNQPVP
jgi:peptidoglycan/LPS O-acetylase OafA/YrhL